jgi:PAS domain S-box-containing protein
MTYKMYNEAQTIFFCLLLCGIVFLIDLYTPLGIASGVLYITVVLFSLKLRNDHSPVIFGFLVSALTVLGYSFSERLSIEWVVLTNRGLALFVIWVTVILGLKIKKTHTKLQRSKQRFHELTEQSPIMLWQAAINGDWIFVSEGWLNFTHNQMNTELGQGWLASIHPEDRNDVSKAYNSLVEGVESFQVICRLKCNGLYRWITLQGNVCYSFQHEVTGFLGTAIDINANKEMELQLEETTQRYYQQDKMASLGSLASGILHEIGNPLAGIIGLLHEIQHELEPLPLSDKTRNVLDSYLLMIFEELNRLTRISQDVSNFSNMVAPDDCLVDLNDVCQRTCRLILHDERMWNIKLKLNIDRNIPAIKLVNDHFIQVLQNLISNAMDACASVTDGALIEVNSSYNQHYVMICVVDNGIGMSSSALARAGEEFYTTKTKGTGLGLPICYSLIKKMNGEMKIRSVEGQGTQITIHFPIN